MKLTKEQLIIENAQLREQNNLLTIKLKQQIYAHNRGGNSVRRAEMLAAKERARTTGKPQLALPMGE